MTVRAARPSARSLGALVFMFTLASASTSASALADPSLVTIPALGTLRCALNSLARECRGVPYASPPLRFSPPTPPAPWSGIRSATTDGPGCMQACTEPAGVCPLSVSEDCLLLNIFTPLPTAMVGTAPLPVLVFFHGGAFRDGFSGGPLYNGTFLSTGSPDPAIVVAVSYRLGAFGWLFGAAPSPTADEPHGNFGLADQRASLEWVRNYIDAFGGDSTRVTIWGQSAGAMSVGCHLLSPPSRGLFTAAVLDSEPLALPFRDPMSARALAGALAIAAHCDAASQSTSTPAACLRAISADALLAAQVEAVRNITVDLPFSLLQVFVPFTPTTGTPDVPNAPLASFQSIPGAAPIVNIPIAMTTVKSEGTIFIYEGFGASPMSPLEYDAVLALAFGPEAGLRIALQYPPPAGVVDLKPLTSNVTTAALFRCATRNATRSLAASPTRTAPIFLGQWDRLLSWAPALWTNATPAYEACWTEVCHAQELPYLFFPQLPGRTAWTPEEDVLSSAGRAYLTSFASRGVMGDGGGNGAPPLVWPPLNGTTGATPRLHLDAPARRLVYEDDACALWDEVGYDFY